MGMIAGMMTLDDLLNITQIFNIKIIFKKLDKEIFGLASGEKGLIILDDSLRFNQKKQKCVLAEEIGHLLIPPRPGHMVYYTTGYRNYDYHKRSTIRTTVAQDEFKALKWAANILISDVELNKLIKSNYGNICELADYFGVEVWFMQLKLKLMECKAG